MWWGTDFMGKTFTLNFKDGNVADGSSRKGKLGKEMS